jgi:hypothetical protein
MKRLLIVLTTLAAPVAAYAEEVQLGAGLGIEIAEYLVETDGDGLKTLLVNGRPTFDPEPFGPVPSDDYARAVEPLCENLVTNSWPTIEREGISNLRIRWDFSPSHRDEEAASSGITVSRFHEMRFRITPDKSCQAWPIAAGLSEIEPALPGGFRLRLAYVDTGLRRDRLQMDYVALQPLSEASPDLLERTARELCILQADHVLERRAEYYPQLVYRSISITIADPAKGDVPARSTAITQTFPVEASRCVSGLSEILANAIRGVASAE